MRAAGGGEASSTYPGWIYTPLQNHPTGLGLPSPSHFIASPVLLPIKALSCHRTVSLTEPTPVACELRRWAAGSARHNNSHSAIYRTRYVDRQSIIKQQADGADCP